MMPAVVAGAVVGAAARVGLRVVGPVAATHFLDGVVRPVPGLGDAAAAEGERGGSGEYCDLAGEGAHLILLRVRFQALDECRRDVVEVSIGPW
jgi:hypothetical protein